MFEVSELFDCIHVLVQVFLNPIAHSARSIVVKTRIRNVILLIWTIVSMTAFSAAYAKDDLPFIEKGILYHSAVDLENPEPVLNGVIRILDYQPGAKKILCMTRSQETRSDAVTGGDLVIVDTTNWSQSKVATDNIVGGRLSTDGLSAVVWNDQHEIIYVRNSGKSLQKIGVHGAAPMFSHDGSLISYQKLADETISGDRQDFFEHAYGIAVYDLKTGKEKMVTGGGVHDFAPVGFSNDLSKLYFNSTRPYDNSPQNHVASIWVVDLVLNRTERLTNSDEAAALNGLTTPIIGDDAIWSSDRSIVISSDGKNGVWIFTLSFDGKYLTASRVAEGDSPRWTIPDQVIAIRANVAGKNHWKSVTIR